MVWPLRSLAQSLLTMRRILLTRTRSFVGGALFLNPNPPPLSPLHPTNPPPTCLDQPSSRGLSCCFLPGACACLPGRVSWSTRTGPCFLRACIFSANAHWYIAFDVPGYIVKYGKARLHRCVLPRLNSGCTEQNNCLLMTLHKSVAANCCNLTYNRARLTPLSCEKKEQHRVIHRAAIA